MTAGLSRSSRLNARFHGLGVARADRRLVERDAGVLDQLRGRLDVARERPLTEDLAAAHDVLTRGLR